MPPLNLSLNFPELQRFSSEVQGNCCAWMEKVKHPSGFPGADLPSQVMFWVSPRPTLCNRYRGHGRFGLFLGDVQATVVFSDAISLAPRAGMFQRTEEWGWAVEKKKGLRSQCLLVSCNHYRSLAQCCSFITSTVRRKQPGASGHG